jgi:hypothetical protein
VAQNRAAGKIMDVGIARRCVSLLHRHDLFDRREPLVDQLLYSFPREAVPLAAPPEHAKLEMGDVVTEPCKCATIRRHRMTVEVACNDLLQPLSLFGNWLMHPLS